MQQNHKRAPEQEEEVAAPKKKARTVRTKADGTPGAFFLWLNITLSDSHFQLQKEDILRKKGMRLHKLLRKMVRVSAVGLILT